MIKCKVSFQVVGYLVEFEDGKSLFLQSDTDICCFGVYCGIIPCPIDWEKDIETLEVDYNDYDLEEIEECPEEYYSIAE